MRVSLVQLAYGDEESLADRTDRVVDLVRGCRGSDLVVLPELWSAGGFAYRDWEERAQPLDGPVARSLARAAREIGAVVHAGSIAERLPRPGPEGRSLCNTSLVFDAEGRRAATYRKIHRFGFSGGEPVLMEAGTEPVVLPLPGGLTGGLATCYDLRFPELFRAYVDRGVTAFVVPAAWPAARVEAWRLLLRARAVEDQCVVLACNTAGTHAGARMGGCSAVIGPDGAVLAEAGTDEQVLTVDVDPGAVAAARASFPVLRDRRM